MITDTGDVFPNIIVDVLQARFQLIDPDVIVLDRPLAPGDPVQCIGVVATMWQPQMDSHEILGKQNFGPTLNRYLVGIQGFIQDMEKARGLRVHGVLASVLRNMLYRDATLRLALASLQTTASGGSTEAVTRWGISAQRFFANEIPGERKTWGYLSVLETWFETEMR